MVDDFTRGFTEKEYTPTTTMGEKIITLPLGPRTIAGRDVTDSTTYSGGIINPSDSQEFTQKRNESEDYTTIETKTTQNETLVTKESEQTVTSKAEDTQVLSSRDTSFATDPTLETDSVSTKTELGGVFTTEQTQRQTSLTSRQTKPPTLPSISANATTLHWSDVDYWY